jgi:hypothetical protein
MNNKKIRNEQSKNCKRRKKAAELGMTLEAYVASITPMDEDARRARRNEQSKACRDRKKATVQAEIEKKERRKAVALRNLAKANEAKAAKRKAALQTIEA